MNTAELIGQVWEKLDNNTTLYPAAEVVSNGLNPAQNLLVLLRPDLLPIRTSVSLLANQAFIDLRVESPRMYALRLVLLDDLPGVSSKQLPVTSLTMLSRRRGWFSERGEPRLHYRYGRHWVGLYKRSTVARTITLIGRGVPTPLNAITGDVEPDIQSSFHPLIGDMAAALLLVKEGAVETEKALRVLSSAVGEEPFGPMKKALERIQRSSAKLEAPV